MDTHRLVIVLFGIACSVLTFAPPQITAKFLGAKTESRLWARLAGIMGFVFILLGFASRELAQTFKVTHTGQYALSMARSLCGGVIVGLLVAVFTKRFENR